ncbi:hypothetical protein VZT92_010237 [Zoarces viviparus]|uniref:Uncharacterized protein n=1 Tax=Zoarces viviparus TaxID=48416 RepID=A0AAW1FEP1_ZOAVI
MNKVVFHFPQRFGCDVYQRVGFQGESPHQTELFYYTLPLDHVTTGEDCPVLELTTDWAADASSPALDSEKGSTKSRVGHAKPKM